jgi:hypothetical protein
MRTVGIRVLGLWAASFGCAPQEPPVELALSAHGISASPPVRLPAAAAAQASGGAAAVDWVRSSLGVVPATFADLSKTANTKKYVVTQWQRADLVDGTERWLAKEGNFVYEVRASTGGVHVSLMSGFAADSELHNAEASLRMGLMMSALASDATAHDRVEMAEKVESAFRLERTVVEWKSRGIAWRVRTEGSMFVLTGSIAG